LPATKEERSLFMKKFRAEIVKNKKLVKIGQEVKALTAKFPTP
jgi:hypothetical protein